MRAKCYVRKKHPFTSYPTAKDTKHSKLAVTDTLEIPVDFFNNTAWALIFAPAIILLTWVPLHKFLFLFYL